jgi:hypothetical protein
VPQRRERAWTVVGDGDQGGAWDVTRNTSWVARLAYALNASSLSMRASETSGE